MGEDDCRTHHHACDCREAMFKRWGDERDKLRKEVERLRNERDIGNRFHDVAVSERNLARYKWEQFQTRVRELEAECERLREQNTQMHEAIEAGGVTANMVIEARQRAETAESRVAELEAESSVVARILDMGAESLNPDSFVDLERIVGELRQVRRAFLSGEVKS